MKRAVRRWVLMLAVRRLPMGDVEALKTMIGIAFAHVQYPGDWCLRNSSEGDEPFLLEKEFKGKSDWKLLDSKFIDQAPDGFGSALSFFSDEAFHFYLPAYLIADVDGLLEQQNMVYRLTHGFTNDTMTELINSLRYGERTWFDAARYKFSIFNKTEAAAIVAYLRHKHESDEFERENIEQALRNYWLERTP